MENRAERRRMKNTKPQNPNISVVRPGQSIQRPKCKNVGCDKPRRRTSAFCGECKN